ncbi:putative serine protease PepD [Ilumatobacter fluminis]|uniref:Putative serine protease PepD n=1 Tax=Ilumatobacter fluminis TaxID=467091 RepID=A0A4R7HX71_9ACTN|nr:trypsin-like peptidase domain-containing protein [Ilumatobacter fluminis]TDT15330.1 putative serine protease PepD [Ilumatobacter fluminis]
MTALPPPRENDGATPSAGSWEPPVHPGSQPDPSSVSTSTSPTMVELTPNDPIEHVAVPPGNPPMSGPTADPTPTPEKTPRQGPRRAAMAGLLAVAMIGSGVAGGLIAVSLDDDGDPTPPQRASSALLEIADGDRELPALDVAAVAAHVAPSVVTISADVEGGVGGAGTSVGTGVITTTDGEILTNSHVVEDATEIRVRLAGESEPREAVLLAADPGNDLALLRIEGDEFAAAEFADPDAIDIGDEVMAIGFALDLDGDPSVTKGIVSALNRTIVTSSDAVLDGLIQTDAAISSGNSGGPLVNSLGQVVGINTAVARGDTFTAATNIGFAISTAEALPIVESLRDQADGEPREEGFLGVSLADRTDGGQGAIVATVEEDTPAADAGLLEGDIVIEVDDAPIEGLAGLVAAIRDLEPGDQTTIVVLREGELMDFTVTLASRADS